MLPKLFSYFVFVFWWSIAVETNFMGIKGVFLEFLLQIRERGGEILLLSQQKTKW